jgi:RimJ/RimL family protein N-acetyltransferase
MVSETSFSLVTFEDTTLLKSFLRTAKSSLESFRYYDSRELAVIQNHIITTVLLRNNEPVGYGHLDQEGDCVWLGIAVSEGFQQLGYGTEIMRFLTGHADKHGILNLHLSVDKENTSAIKLYRKFGFFETGKQNERSIFMIRKTGMTDIYVSSMAFAGMDVDEIVSICRKEGFALEFSSGMPYRSDMEEIYVSAEVKKIPHNYFPAPEMPFVLNLGSRDRTIRSLSIQHCLNGLRLSKLANAQFFSAHAGFCIDPNPSELGQKIQYEPQYKKEEHVQLFFDSLEVILEEARRLDIDFLIENNVIAPFNMDNMGGNPLLCCDSAGIQEVFKGLQHERLGLLLDTAHLKVSAATLNLSLVDELSSISDYIKAIHHSDNNGQADTNDKLTDGYWFFDFLPKFKMLPHVLEVKNISPATIHEQLLLLKFYAR